MYIYVYMYIYIYIYIYKVFVMFIKKIDTYCDPYKGAHFW